MEALIAYFKSLESRLAALEADDHRVQNDDTDQDERITSLEAAIAVQCAQIAQLQTELAALKRMVTKSIREEMVKEPAAQTPIEVEPEEVKPQAEEIEETKPEEVKPQAEETVEVTPLTEKPAAVKPMTEAATQASSTSIYGKAVTDIKQAISLGDRFLFQRELFGGNGEQMQRALDAINKFDSFDEAIAYVRQTYGWDEEQAAFQLFVTVLHRRFYV